MKLNEMEKGDSNTSYFIHYYDYEKNMWCPYISYKGNSYFTNEYLIFHITEVKKKSNKYKVYRQVTTRVE